MAWAVFGSWVLTTSYLYWQWWHYTRQSYGVSRIYWPQGFAPAQRHAHELTIYAVPVWGILYRSYQAPDKYLFTEVKVLPVPFWLVAVGGQFCAGGYGVLVNGTDQGVLAKAGSPLRTRFTCVRTCCFRRWLSFDQRHQSRLAGAEHLAQLPVHPDRLDVQ